MRAVRPAVLATLATIGAAFCILTGPAPAAPGCGDAVPCRVALGEYRIAMPAGEHPVGALVYFHGYMASAKDEMDRKALVDVALSRGLAFVAPDGRDKTWTMENSPEQVRDDTAFVNEVLDDLGTRFGITGDRVILGGFSLGASMAWYTICHSGGRVAAAVTFSGVFWEPLPTRASCPATPPPMIHFHGTKDRTFPLEGREIDGRWRQGNTYASLALVREWAACPAQQTKPIVVAGITCAATTGCARGPIVACIHDRAHEVDPAWLAGGLDFILPTAGIGDGDGSPP